MTNGKKNWAAYETVRVFVYRDDDMVKLMVPVNGASVELPISLLPIFLLPISLLPIHSGAENANWTDLTRNFFISPPKSPFTSLWSPRHVVEIEGGSLLSPVWSCPGKQCDLRRNRSPRMKDVSIPGPDLSFPFSQWASASSGSKVENKRVSRSSLKRNAAT